MAESERRMKGMTAKNPGKGKAILHGTGRNMQNIDIANSAPNDRPHDHIWSEDIYVDTDSDDDIPVLLPGGVDWSDDMESLSEQSILSTEGETEEPVHMGNNSNECMLHSTANSNANDSLFHLLPHEAIHEEVGDDNGATNVEEQPRTLSKEKRKETKEKYAKKIETLLSVETIAEDMLEATHSKYCDGTCHKELTGDQVYNARSQFLRKKQGKERQEHLIHLIRLTQMTHNNHCYHSLEGSILCRGFWISGVLHTSLSTYTRALTLYNKNVLELHPTAHKKLGDRGSIALAFMQNKVSQLGDVNPAYGKTILPMGITRQGLYAEYLEQESDTGVKPISSSRFRQIWQHHVNPQVSFCSVGKIVRCPICTGAETRIAGEMDPVHKAEMKTEHSKHLHKQRLQRELYYKNRDLNVKEPERYKSIIIDSMDQTKLGIPHWANWRRPKNCSYVQPLNITGVKIHNRATKVNHYMDVLQYPHDPNLIMNCLLHALLEEQPLPPTLFVQLDNCFRENKNMHVMGLMALMVKLDLVQEVFVNFLMTGHTHEDIDQLFSRVSICLKHHDAFTIQDMHNNIQKSMKNPTPNVILLGQMYDIKSWMDPYINRIAGISHGHHFWFAKDGRGHVTLHYKYWSTDENWLPLPEEEQLEIFRCDEERNQILPRGQPSELPPKFGMKTDFERLQYSMRSIRLLLPTEAFDWWLQWMTRDNEATGEESQTEQMWSEMADYWDFPLSTFQPYRVPQLIDPDEEPGTANPVRALRERELATPQITTVRRNTFMVDAISTAVGRMAVYTTYRSDEKYVGRLISTEGDEKGKFERFVDDGSGKWKTTQRYNVVAASKVLRIFTLNRNGELPKPVREWLAAMYVEDVEESDNE